MERLHLICNAHIDPYWMWEWEEGAAEAISTFRSAADLCEEFDGFVFNHNEVILYKWIKEYEPDLFARIQRLVKAGKWHIMGGWYLQPDCNMPSGESFVRQILTGRCFFREHFGVEPTTANCFDPFGHTRGLVQILRKAGYDSYLHCRPDQTDCPLPDTDYCWVGYDGSEVHGHRTLVWYGSPKFGKARETVEGYLAKHADRPQGLVTWGVGNHGGGPSRKDLRDLAELIKEKAGDVEIVHSTPEQYFAEWRDAGRPLPRHEADINPWGVGCYTSQVRLKQKHRLLENEIYAVEKMASTAALQGLLAYPHEDLHQALCDLMVAEFHDILPGSSIQPVEDAGLRLMDHGLEICSRLKARAFFALAAGQPKAAEGEIPVLVYNPHPFPVEGVFECEFNLPDATFEQQFSVPHVYQDGKLIPCQPEKEYGNINLDWRKHMVFRATLQPSQMNRFDCKLEVLKERPKPSVPATDGRICVTGARATSAVNLTTGLLEQYQVDGVDYIQPGAFKALVMQDNEDPWSMTTHMYRDLVGEFELMSDEEATSFSGVRQGVLPAVRVVEDGPVRTAVEALFRHHDSFLVLTYRLPKIDAELEIHARVHWNEKDRMLKLAIPVGFDRYMGQVAYGRDTLPGAEREVVAQKWVAAVSDKQDRALTIINDGMYGSDYVDGEVRLSLLRSPAYSGHPIGDRPIVLQDRYTPRIDQGERQFRIWVQGGPKAVRLDAVDREALVRNEKPMAVSFCPSGLGDNPAPGVLLSDDVVLIAAFKRAEDGDGYILRLFEPTGEPRETTVSIPVVGVQEIVKLSAFEIKSLRLKDGAKAFIETDLTERPLKG